MRSSYIDKGFSIKNKLGEFVLLPLVLLQNVELGILFFDDTVAARGLEELFSSCAVMSVFGSDGK